MTNRYPAVEETPAPPLNAAEDAQARQLVQANTENFPVASLLLPQPQRQQVLAFYQFARLADDIADDPALAESAKLRRLRTIAEAIKTGNQQELPEKLQAYGQLLTAGTCSRKHGLALLDAFMQDAVKTRYATWEELLAYCMRSAAPVGRTVLEIFGEDKADLEAADALCNALQVLNHLQDCQEDYRLLDRVYLPQDWLAAESATVEMLDAAAASPALRRVLDRLLDATDTLLTTARHLPPTIRHRRLRLETAITLALAEGLAKRLRRRDPLAAKTRLGGWPLLYALGRGLGHAFLSGGKEAP